jgi:NADP-dependent 3-hydroxy acid dehydrogenase YdfG
VKQVIVVTGASSGFGALAARALARNRGPQCGCGESRQGKRN